MDVNDVHISGDSPILCSEWVVNVSLTFVP